MFSEHMTQDILQFFAVEATVIAILDDRCLRALITGNVFARCFEARLR